MEIHQEDGLCRHHQPKKRKIRVGNEQSRLVKHQYYHTMHVLVDEINIRIHSVQLRQRIHTKEFQYMNYSLESIKIQFQLRLVVIGRDLKEKPSCLNAA